MEISLLDTYVLFTVFMETATSKLWQRPLIYGTFILSSLEHFSDILPSHCHAVGQNARFSLLEALQSSPCGL